MGFLDFMGTNGNLILGGANMLMGVGTAIAAGAKGKQARKEYQKLFPMLDQRETELGNWFNKQYYQNITQRTDIQNMMRMLEENQKQAEERASAQAAVMGATPEMQLASAEASRKSYADALAEIASNASTLKDTYLQNYLGRTGDLFNQRIGVQQGLSSLYQQDANNLSQASMNAFSSAANLLGGTKR